MAILRTWDCSTEHNTYAGIGTTIFLTAVLASLSGGYALWTVFQSYPYAITFGLLWGILIFNLDRYIVMSLHKSRGGFGAFCRQVATASPRLLLALLIASVITVPLELKIFEREIIDQLEENGNGRSTKTDEGSVVENGVIGNNTFANYEKLKAD